MRLTSATSANFFGVCWGLLRIFFENLTKSKHTFCNFFFVKLSFSISQGHEIPQNEALVKYLCRPLIYNGPDCFSWTGSTGHISLSRTAVLKQAWQCVLQQLLLGLLWDISLPLGKGNSSQGEILLWLNSIHFPFPSDKPGRVVPLHRPRSHSVAQAECRLFQQCNIIGYL